MMVLAKKPLRVTTRRLQSDLLQDDGTMLYIEWTQAHQHDPTRLYNTDISE